MAALSPIRTVLFALTTRLRAARHEARRIARTVLNKSSTLRDDASAPPSLPGDTAALSLLLYFGVTNVLFLHYFLTRTAAWALTTLLILLAVSATWARRRPDDMRSARNVFPRAWRRWVVLFIGAAAFCTLGGEGHFFYANSDWTVRDAVLTDLVSHAWPIGYEWSGERMALRAPLGMYLVPALAGKLIGIQSAHFGLLVQNAFVLSLVLFLVTDHIRSAFRRWTVITVFLMFSGLDIVGRVLPVLKTAAGGADIVSLPSHLEAWARLFQYSSHVTQLFWVPNHALAGWAFIALYWADLKSGRFSIRPVLLSGLLLLWSPFAAMGALPFCAHSIFRSARRWPAAGSVVASTAIGALVIPTVFYLSAGAGGVERRAQPLTNEFVHAYVPFVILEFGLYVVILGLRERSWELGLTAVTLLAIPFYKVGFSNDFAMRASIPALAMLALVVADHLGRPNISLVPRTLVVLLLLVGAVTPAFEIRAALTMPAWAPSRCNLVDAWTHGPFKARSPASYLADLQSFSRFSVFSTPRPPFLSSHPEVRCWGNDAESPVDRSSS
jgi:hypothetical protein